MKKYIFLLIIITAAYLQSQTDTILVQKLDSLLNYNENLEHSWMFSRKNIDDLMWFQKVGDVLSLIKFL